MSFISIYATILARHQSRGLSFTWRRRSSSLRRRSSCWRTTRLSGDGERDGYPDDKGAENARRFQLSARIFISCSNIHSLLVSFLCYRALQNCHGAALPGSIAAHASSGQFLGSLLSYQSAQLLHITVADGTILLLLNFDNRRSLERDGYRIAQCT